MPRKSNNRPTKVLSIRIAAEYFDQVKTFVNELMKELEIENHKYHRKGTQK